MSDDHSPPSDPYEPDMITVVRLNATDTRPERWSWDVTFAAPHEGLNQEGTVQSLYKALLCITETMENARDAQREDREAGCE